eukprot:TRINITY_DN3238_c0_g1_i1.p1 TRINITY_DN3238_c0_g1~~TRINITY_DN3238_c0_g1_i1.p1  ORF type:complete len:51 (+),score=5.81 TRINITY_DN3238_c0_g1_i1:32-184(+)
MSSSLLYLAYWYWTDDRERSKMFLDRAENLVKNDTTQNLDGFLRVVISNL